MLENNFQSNQTAPLTAGSISNAMLAAGIDGAKLIAASVVNAKLATGIDGGKLTAGTVANAALAAGIDGAKLTAGSVTDAKLAAGINGNKLTAGTPGTCAGTATTLGAAGTKALVAGVDFVNPTNLCIMVAVGQNATGIITVLPAGGGGALIAPGETVTIQSSVGAGDAGLCVAFLIVYI